MDKRDWGDVLTFKCPGCEGHGERWDEGGLNHAGDPEPPDVVICGDCTSGTIGIELKPEAGALVDLDGEWQVIHVDGWIYSDVYMTTIDPEDEHVTCTPILPARATLEAAGLSVDDGLDMLPWKLFAGERVLPLKSGRMVRGETIIRYEGGTSLDIDGDNAMRADLDMHTALLAWAGVK
jgi:hypothetical protein